MRFHRIACKKKLRWLLVFDLLLRVGNNNITQDKQQTLSIGVHPLHSSKIPNNFKVSCWEVINYTDSSKDPRKLNHK